MRVLRGWNGVRFYNDRRRSAQHVKVWGQWESTQTGLGSATRFPIRDQGRLKTPKINKRPGTSI